jgi:uncharacterized membrane protein YfcA
VLQVYLPIAEMSVNLFFLIGIGGAVGFLSGLFGVGGGFLLTPLLIFSGVPAPVAVASVTGQVVAASTSGAGQLDLFISLGFLVLLGSVGSLMLVESSRAILKQRKGVAVRERLPNQHNWIHGLPLRVRFKKSRLYISVLPVLVIGLFIGFVGSLLGIGGGFIMVPALVYLLRVPGNVVIGTSLAQVVAMMAATTVLHAVQSQSVDIMLAFCLMVGGTAGAQFGASAGKYLRGEQLRGLLALLVLAVAIRFGLSLVIAPADPFSMAVIGGMR